MDIKNIVEKFWNDINSQNWENLSSYFKEGAVINWDNTNESFNVQEFIKANSEYPGDWLMDIKKLVVADMRNEVISVVRVFLKDKNISFHAVSFFKFDSEKIEKLNEYWGIDVDAPQWRVDMKIGRKIK